jgi:hypothetical protein
VAGGWTGYHKVGGDEVVVSEYCAFAIVALLWKSFIRIYKILKIL